jgi:hypothetical protein
MIDFSNCLFFIVFVIVSVIISLQVIKAQEIFLFTCGHRQASALSICLSISGGKSTIPTFVRVLEIVLFHINLNIALIRYFLIKSGKNFIFFSALFA